jgi:hypothetical protein
VSVNEVPDAAIEAPADAVVTTSATNICGSDLHIYQAGAADWRLTRSSGTKPLRGRRSEDARPRLGGDDAGHLRRPV